MPLGAAKVGLMAASTANANYFGDGSLGDCQFGASGITQSGDSVAIDAVLTTGSEAGGPAAVTYGSGTQTNQIQNPSACYETTVLNKSGSYDGDMWVGNFTNLTIDASTTLTTDQPCRGMLIYCSGDAVINGALSMTGRGALADPTASGGGDTSAVNSNGLKLGLFTASGTDTLAANDFAGSGTASVAAVANQPAIVGNGVTFNMTRQGTTGPVNGTTGGAILQSGGGGNGRPSDGVTPTYGSYGSCFAGGSGGGGKEGPAAGTSGTPWAGAGGNGGSLGASAIGAGSGNPAGTGANGGGGNNGNGGLMLLIVKGDVTIGAGGYVDCTGQRAWNAGYYVGSATGGGIVYVLHGGTLTNNGTIQAAQGGGGAGGYGPGGTGGKHTLQIGT
jgi:hypothetical protein|tara:strand:+ start:455 stop:1621 length:1167 start_codon:yes stop_codon:yes gene_type:complete